MTHWDCGDCADAATNPPRRVVSRRHELYRDLDRRNATVAAPARDWTVAWFVGACAFALLADALLGAGALYLILKAVG